MILKADTRRTFMKEHKGKNLLLNCLHPFPYR
ncbi:Hypothetical protein Minf_1331 [Methylacidiphilum infernorum V4]|uniref:Uncharacterized protein n=1 Tax=Methylacidiphilum infernorum (isolate V4) TaxID=481448 RepID=B3DVN2_METI4|nr:Hypothetical protein Minf_1331 [Methylacidiphilum infernorum V4]